MTACPDESELLALVTDDAGTDELRAHAVTCPACRERAARLRMEVASVDGLGLGDTPGPGDAAGQATTLIGKYLIVGELHRDDATTTFRALHPVVRTEVAVYRLDRTPVTDPAARELLAAEARRLAALDLPGVVHIRDLDFDEQGRPFLVLDRSPGRPLEQYLRETRPSPARLAELLAELARSLAAIQRAGLVHGDLRATSLRVDDRGRVWIAGLGVGQLRAIAEGRPLPDDSRADVRALVALLDAALGTIPVGPTVRRLRGVAARAAGEPPGLEGESADALAGALARAARPPRWRVVLLLAAALAGTALAVATWLRLGRR
jgi:hypothetical protein